MNAIQKLKSLPRKTFAKMLLKVQNSNWWKESLLDDAARVNNQRIEFARKQLPPLTSENEWCGVLFENVASSLKSDYSLKSEPIPAYVLNLGALVSKHLIPLHKIIPVVPLTGPVGIALIMRAVTNSTNPNAKPSNSISIFRETAESTSKRLTTRLHLESGADSDLTYLDAVAKDMAGEIIQDVLEKMKVLAGVPDEVLIESWMVGPEAQNKMLQVIETNSVRIAADTRRGRTVAIVTSKEVLDVLIDQDAINLNPQASLVPTNIELVGTLKNSGDSVYVSPYSGKGEILLAYRAASNMDSGCIFMPYIPAIGSGVIVDSQTFEPRESFVTRGGFVTDKDSKKYYRLIDASKVLS